MKNIISNQRLEKLAKTDREALKELASRINLLLRPDYRVPLINRCDYKKGLTVKFNQSANPKYLIGIKAEIIRVMRTRCVVKLSSPIGRFSGKIRAPMEILEIL